MSYDKTIWKSKDIITREKMQKIEDQLEVLSEQNTSIDNNYISAPTSPDTGAFLVWSGSAWVAQTLSTWQGGNF